MRRTKEFEEAKFKELVLYIAGQCKDDIFWGVTKLNKQLFFSDFLAYRELGEAITGADYMAIEYGPAPKRMCPIRETMLLDEDIIIERRAFQERIIPLRPAKLDDFSPEELALVDEVIDQLRESDSDEVVELSHRFHGWVAARREGLATGQHVVIPYGTVMVSGPTLTDEELAETMEMATKYEWRV